MPSAMESFTQPFAFSMGLWGSSLVQAEALGICQAERANAAPCP